MFSIFRIVPRLDYNHYVEPYLQRLTTEDIFYPAYDNAPFEPVYAYDVDATTQYVPADSEPAPIGYRPAWSGYQYRVNRSHGSFASPTQSFWVLQRSFVNIDPASDAGDRPDDILRRISTLKMAILRLLLLAFRPGTFVSRLRSPVSGVAL